MLTRNTEVIRHPIGYTIALALLGAGLVIVASTGPGISAAILLAGAAACGLRIIRITIQAFGWREPLANRLIEDMEQDMDYIAYKRGEWPWRD